MNHRSNTEGQPPLTRPSLFGATTNADAPPLHADQRVLLPAIPLGNVRPLSKPSSQREIWGLRALFVLMSAGVLVVLYSFVQVVRQQHGVAARATPQVGSPVDTDSATARIVGTANSSADNSAHIEAFTDATPVTKPVLVPSMSLTLSTAPPQKQDTQVPMQTTPKSVPPRQSTPRQSTPAAQSTAAHASTRTSDDVALLEAMMAHAISRRAPPSSWEDLQACSSLQGTEAANCKAKACMQHPGAAPCLEHAP